MISRFSLSLSLAALGSSTTLCAQCANAWVPFGALPGVDYTVNAVAEWDPDGPGPLAPRVVVGGTFGQAGTVAASGVAAWDPATAAWSALGAGIAGLQTGVNVLLAMPNGDLIAGGSCFVASGPAQHPLLRWNGATWTPFGGLTPAPQGVTALARLPNGDLAVGGYFTSAGAVPLPYVGMWNGTAWSSLGGGMDGPVLELVVMPNGDLVALGQFTTAGGVPANGVARWNGVAWSNLGGGLTGSMFGYGPQGETAVVLANGDLVVGGMFTSAGGVSASNVARWDGASWSALGGGIGGLVATSIGVRGLAALPNGDVIAGGYFVTAGGAQIANLARWDGSSWSSLGAGGPNAAVNALGVLASGDLVAGGVFTLVGATGASRVARWDGAVWSSLGGGTAPSDHVRAMVAMPDGSIVAGGGFRAAGTMAANGIARWDGVSWSPLGTGFPTYGRVNSLALQGNGDLIAGGYGFVSRWDGVSWTFLATTLAAGAPHADLVKAVAVRPNGNVVIGGDFVQIGVAWAYGLAEWNGSSWSEVGGGVFGMVDAITVLANGV